MEADSAHQKRVRMEGKTTAAHTGHQARRSRPCRHTGWRISRKLVRGQTHPYRMPAT